MPAGLCMSIGGIPINMGLICRLLSSQMLLGQAARLQAVLLAQHVVDLLRHALQLHALVGARLVYQVDRLVRQEAALRDAGCTSVPCTQCAMEPFSPASSHRGTQCASQGGHK